MLKLSLLTNMVAPYRVPFFKALADDPRIRSLRILVCVEREIDRHWTVTHDASYQVKRLAGWTFNLRGPHGLRILHLRVGIFWELLRHRPDRLIIGDASWTSYLAGAACRLLRIPYLVWNEITVHSRVSAGLAAQLRRALYRHARTCIASGELAKAFLREHGVEESRIAIAHNAVDNDFFLAQKARWEPDRDQLRRDLGLEPEDFTLLFVGQLIPRKCIQETLEAVAEASKAARLHFLIAGTGPLESALREQAEALGFKALTFCGHVDPERLSQLYVACDAVILMSKDEPWGMVVNESIIFKKPGIFSMAVGAAIAFSEFDPNIQARHPNELANTIETLAKATSPTRTAYTPPSPSQMKEAFVEATSR